MNTPKVNLTINQHAGFYHKFVWMTKKKRPIDLTGYTALLQARLSFESAVVLELSTENGGILLGGTAGTIELFLTDEQTAVLTAPKLVYDFLLIPPVGEPRRLFEGKLVLSLGSSRLAP